MSEEERAAGLGEVRSFLSALKGVPVDTMDAPAARAAIKELVAARLGGSSNPIVRAVCQD